MPVLIDLTIGGLLLFFLLLGVATGAIRQVAGLAALAAGVLAAALLGPTLAAALRRWIAAEAGAGWVARIGLFLLAYLLVRLFAGLLARWVARRKTADRADRLAGAGVGLVKGLLLVGLLMGLLYRYGTPAWRLDARASRLGAPTMLAMDFFLRKADEYDVTERARSAARAVRAAGERIRSAADAGASAPFEPSWQRRSAERGPQGVSARDEGANAEAPAARTPLPPPLGPVPSPETLAPPDGEGAR